MADTTCEVHVPNALLQFGIDQEEIQRRLNEWLTLSLFADGHLSSGKAATLLGISRVAFLALLRARSVAYINYTPDELAEATLVRKGRDDAREAEDPLSEQRIGRLRRLVDAYDRGLDTPLRSVERAALPLALARQPLVVGRALAGSLRMRHLSVQISRNDVVTPTGREI